MLATELKIAAGVFLALFLGTGVLRCEAFAGEQAAGATEQTADARKARGDEENIRGVWLIASSEKNGRKAVGKARLGLEQMVIIFEADKVIMYDKGARIGTEAGYKLYPDKQPKVIDLGVPTPDGAGEEIAKGIYRLDGDKLTLCINTNGNGKEPKDFVAGAGSGVRVLELKRDRSSTNSAATVDLAKSTAAHQKSANRLQRLASGMLRYRDTYGRFPAAAVYAGDKPLLSWRVAILPFLGEDALYRQFKPDEPWDSQHNLKLLERMPKVYEPAGDVKTREPYTTFYQVFTGAGTVFNGAEGLRSIDLRDAPANTFLIVEAGGAVPWTKPEDLPYSPDKPLPDLGGLFKEGFHAAFCDGSVRLIPRKVKEPLLRALIIAHGADAIDLDELNR